MFFHHQRRIICLCGSTRFMSAFRAANLRFTLEGHIVLSIGCDTKSDEMLNLDNETKRQLDELHLHKIDMANEVHFLNDADGYIGDSTANELAYAIFRGKPISWLDPVLGEKFMVDCSHRLGDLIAKHAYKQQ